jgi:phosphate:Na+ symporter
MDDDKMSFSESAMEELQVFMSAVTDVMERAFKAFNTGDLELARTVEPLEEVIDSLNLEMKDRHVMRLRTGECTVEVGIQLSDITTNLERVADHCSNIAVCLLSMEDNKFDPHKYLRTERSAENKDFVKEEELFEGIYRLPVMKQ